MFDNVRHSKDVKRASDRSFGLVFFIVFIVIGLWPASRGDSFRWWAFAAALPFGFSALVAPWLLRPLNYLWYRFGMLLHATVSPIVLGFIFAFIVVPTGLLLRLFGKDVLSIGAQNQHKTSYWIPREKTSSTSDSMRNQF